MAEEEQFVRPARTWRIGLGALLVVIVLGVAATVGIGVVRAAGSAAAVTLGPAASAAPVYVHVSGAVQTPGLYVIDPDGRVVDAIAAAGGFTDLADQTSVNLARALVDGEQLVVGTVGADGTAEPVTDTRVNINTAGEAELDALPGIGPAIAARIVGWRESQGAFASVDDLLLVSGIGDKLLEQLRPLVRV